MTTSPRDPPPAVPPVAESPRRRRRARRRRLLLAAVAVAVVGALWLGGAADLLSFETLREHRDALQQWVAARRGLAAALFVLAYAAAVAASLPGAVWLTLAGGFLFGTVAGAALAVAGATAGAVVVFLLAGSLLREPWRRRAGPALACMEDGFRRDAFSYLLVLRLVPLFPFWLVNLVPALLGVPLRPYVLATVLGIIPGAVVYAGVGNGLDAVFAAGGRPDLSLLSRPEILLPLLGLALLALVPVAWRRWRTRHDR
ncbi:TVP38/TMEM64 family protein [Caenispirillum bisanense]|uniref:TVP38/TMEM64 family protein n=1 Tax=Caenispirillum bisanense TaxID=414052 RepID=UPI0031DC810F